MVKLRPANDIAFVSAVPVVGAVSVFFHAGGELVWGGKVVTVSLLALGLASILELLRTRHIFDCRIGIVDM